ncbi:MAG: peptidoglycan endopeptidase [Mycobacterium sp.]|nr:peptidoglycan endopeptidase [Mycobacterium sp.]
MFALVTLMSLVNQVSGTPYISGGDSPAGTDCSGLASWVANAATGRPTFGDRFNTGNQAAALRARGFQEGTAPNALVIGWNSGHTAVTLPDGTPVSSGEGGGVKIGGGGAYQPQFTHHMFLPMPADATNLDPNAMNVPVMVDDVNPQLPPPPPPADPAFVDVNAAPLPPEQLPAPPAPDAPPVDAPPPGELPPPPADAPPGSLI